MDVLEVHSLYKDRIDKKLADAQKASNDLIIIEEALKIIKEPFSYLFHTNDKSDGHEWHFVTWEKDEHGNNRVHYRIEFQQKGSYEPSLIFNRPARQCKMDDRIFIKNHLGEFYKAILDEYL